MALSTDSGGAGQYRGGLGYEKDYRALVDCYTLVSADRVRLGCYGVNGGSAGKPFSVAVDLEGRNEMLGGLEDDVTLRQGEVVRVRTTGGGGWGDPLERDPEHVRMDVWQAKVSVAAAHAEYGVVVVGETGAEPALDVAATAVLREKMRVERGERPSGIDRGPGLEDLTPAHESTKASRFA